MIANREWSSTCAEPLSKEPQRPYPARVERPSSARSNDVGLDEHPLAITNEEDRRAHVGA